VDFIPVAETTGDIVSIGEWVLRQACLQLAEWRRQSGRELRMSVNVAPLQLEQANLVGIVEDTLVQSGLPGDALVLEITEGVLIEAGPLQVRTLRRLRELGPRIALDDFGTGYSALGYLKRFPVDVLKIDRSFVSGLESDRHDTALVQAILALGKGVDMEVVAEGIETPGQRQLLRLLGCRHGQGFLFAPPLPAAEVAVETAAAARSGPPSAR
jgi:EAL domain-containing protein (putative c-di-GMP-specific phosphodiesterase class I)